LFGCGLNLVAIHKADEGLLAISGYTCIILAAFILCTYNTWHLLYFIAPTAQGRAMGLLHAGSIHSVIPPDDPD
jgi:hypothetical protein